MNKKSAADLAHIAIDTAHKLINERDALVAQVTALQQALYFWLPLAPADSGPVGERICEDAQLLRGFLFVEDRAQSIGWIELRKKS